MTDIDNEFKIKIKCKYHSSNEYSGINGMLCNTFKCNNFEKGYVKCIGCSYVDWVFFLMNKKHLIEVKDE